MKYIKYILITSVLSTICTVLFTGLYDIKEDKKFLDKEIMSYKQRVIEDKKEKLKDVTNSIIVWLDISLEKHLNKYKNIILKKQNDMNFLFKIIQKNNNYKLDEFTWDDNYFIYKTTFNKKEDKLFFIPKKTIENEIKKDLKNFIYNLRFSNKNSYIWVNKVLNKNGGDNYAIRLIHPNLKNTEGIFLSTKTKDVKANLPYKDELEGVFKSKDGVFFEYYFKLLKEDKIAKKIAYAKLFEPFNWIISYGIYFKDLENLITSKQKIVNDFLDTSIIKVALFAFITISIFILICVYLLNKFSKGLVKTSVKKKNNQIKMKDELLLQQSKMAAMGEILENISHQWKTPLSKIYTLSSGLLVKKELNLLNDKELVDFVNEINSSTIHLSKTLDNFRDFLKPSNEKILFSLEKVFNSTKELISSKLKAKNINLIEDIEDVKIIGLSNELIQVFVNIINNSCDAHEKTNTNQKYIFVTIKKDEKFTYINIYDNAGGIKLKDLSKVFNAHFTTKENIPTNGIGLFMTKEIITKHMNGEISVKNISFKYNQEKMQGASFEIKLPI